MDGSGDKKVNIKHVPDLTIGDRKDGGLDRNLNRNEKTGNGVVHLDPQDEKVITSEVTEQLAFLARAPEYEEYIYTGKR